MSYFDLFLIREDVLASKCALHTIPSLAGEARHKLPTKQHLPCKSLDEVDRLVDVRHLFDAMNASTARALARDALERAEAALQSLGSVVFGRAAARARVRRFVAMLSNAEKNFSSINAIRNRLRRLHWHSGRLRDAFGRQPAENEDHGHCELGGDAEHDVGHFADPVVVRPFVKGQQQELNRAEEHEEAKAGPEPRRPRRRRWRRWT